MNLYSQRQHFGALLPVPESVYTEGVDAVLAELLHEDNTHPLRLDYVLSLALRFSRTSILQAVLVQKNWDSEEHGMFFRARIRHYSSLLRPLAESGNEKEILQDYLASSRDDSPWKWEAFASVVRLLLLQGKKKEARPFLRQLKSQTRESCQALLGVLIFQSELPTTPLKKARQLLGKALKLAENMPEQNEEDQMLPIWLRLRLGLPFDELLESLVLKHNREAMIFYWQHHAPISSLPQGLHALHSHLSDGYELDSNEWEPFSDQEQRTALSNLEDYRKRRPADPRCRVLQGIWEYSKDADQAQNSWRGALLVDERHADSWYFLGLYYQKSWELSPPSHQEVWLESAMDAFLKAASFAPLSPIPRITLGLLQRNSGDCIQGALTLESTLHLTRDSLGLDGVMGECWTDAVFLESLDLASREAAAAKALELWDSIEAKGCGDHRSKIGCVRVEAFFDSQNSIMGDSHDQRGRSFSETLSRIPHSYFQAHVNATLQLAENMIACGFCAEAQDLLSLLEFLDGEQGARWFSAFGQSLLPEDINQSATLFHKAFLATSHDSPHFLSRLFAAVDALLGIEDYESAHHVLQVALEYRDCDIDVLRRLVDVLAQCGREQEGMHLYQTLLEHEPSIDVYEDAAWYFRENGKSQEGEVLLLKGLHLFPQEARLWNQLGVHRMESGWDEETIPSHVVDSAIQAYRQAILFDPNTKTYRGNLGDALRQIGEWEEAESLFQKILQEDGEAPFVLNALARLQDERAYAQEGIEGSSEDWDDAGKNYLQAAALAPHDEEMQRDAAWWLYRERRLEEAADFYHQARLLHSDELDFYSGEAQCLHELGEEERAENVLQMALQHWPEEARLYGEYSAVLLGQRRWNQAEVAALKAVEFSQEAAWAWEALAECYEASAEFVEPIPSFPTAGTSFQWSFQTYSEKCQAGGKPFSQAVEGWEKALKESSQKDRIHCRLGVALLRCGECHEAQIHFQAASTSTQMEIRLDAQRRLVHLQLLNHIGSGFIPGETLLPQYSSLKAWEHSAFLHEFALLQASQGRWEEAYQSLLSQSHLFGQNPIALGNLGLAAMQCGRMDEAENLLKKALVLDGQNAGWHNALGLVFLEAHRLFAAVEEFQAACLLDPHHSEYPANLALCSQGISPLGGPLQ